MKRLLGRLAGVLLTGFGGLLLGLAGVFLYLNPQIPSATTYRDLRLQTPLRVFASDGSLMAEYGERRRIPIPIDEFPPLFVSAVLDTEDKRFYSHQGIDFVTLVRATMALVRSPDEIPPGASTITMQLARNISFSLEQTFLRKFKEMLLALKIERELTKDEILELYLNVIPFGKRAYGGQAAALTYYGKPLSELDVAQFAMLAGIPQAPSIGNPINGPERALARRNLVLGNMLRQGSIDQATHDAAVAAPITAAVHEREVEVDAPWVAEWVRQQAIDRFGRDVYEDGYEVWTSVDPRLQHAANAALRAGLTTYDRRHGYRGPERLLEPPPDGDFTAEVLDRWQATLADTPVFGDENPALVMDAREDGFTALLADGRRIEVPLTGLRWARAYMDEDTRGPRPRSAAEVVTVGDLVRVVPGEDGWSLGQLPAVQGALVSIDPDDGAVRALVGGYDFRRLQFNHALQAARQPGSNIKPFIYSAALDAGYTPASLFNDAPLVFEDENLEGYYRPKNDDGEFGGPTRLRRALYRSINLVSMRILLAVGAGEAIEYSRRFGFDTSTFPRNLQLAIGGGTMALTPMEVARAYAVFANGGYLVDPWVIERVTLGAEERVYESRPPTVCTDCERQAMRPPRTSVAESPNDAARQDEPEPLPPAPRVLDERTAYIMHAMLGDVVRYGTGRRARELEREDLAGKTGTTNAADVWFSGYQRSLATTVWVGFSDNTALGSREFGSNTALPIWIDYMREAMADVPEFQFEQPPGIVRVRIDPDTGLLARPDQDNAIVEVFRSEDVPVALSAGDEEGDDEAAPENIF